MKIHSIDLEFRNLPQSILAFLVESGDELALVETGPASCLDACLRGIRQLGHDPADVKKVLVTHIHLDHSGAVGWWAEQGAQIHVHARGVKHLINPDKLIQGATMIYGEAMDLLWGEVKPVPEEAIVSLQEGDQVQIGEETMTVWETPGHAFHQHAFITGDGRAFVGDAAGMRMPGKAFISPTTAPSQFDPESYLKTIDRLREGDFSEIFLTHSGGFQDVEDHLRRYRRIIEGATELIHAHRSNGASREEIHDHFLAWNQARARRDGLSVQEWQCYENANPTSMSADGILLYWDRAEKERSTS